jgi:type IV pilus assembly protein PilV
MMNRKHAHRTIARSRGFTLLETLVALVVFSIGLLGVVALQARAIQYSVDSEDRSRAALLADDLATTMWTQGTTSIGTGATNAWSARVAAALPNSTATVSAPDTDGVVTVSLVWRPPARKTGEPDSRYSTRVVLP